MIVRELTAHPTVVALAAVSSAAPAAAFTDTAESQISVPIDYQFVSPAYFQLLDIALVRGRGSPTLSERRMLPSRSYRRAPPGGSGQTVMPSGASSAFTSIVQRTR
jgi:hypothetical protein